MRSLIDHIRNPDVMINAMLDPIGTRRSLLLQRANVALLNRRFDILLQYLASLRRRRWAMDGMIHHMRDRPGNINDELNQQIIENSNEVHNHQVLLANCGAFIRRMVPFLRSFTAFGPVRFDFPFPYRRSISHIILWLNARVKVASPRSELSANSEFVEMHQLSVW